MQGITSDVAYKVTERINRMFENAEYTDQKLKFRVMIGVSNYPENCTTLSGLVDAAKHALLESKRHHD